MAFKADEPNTRRQIARFSVDEWISFRERLTRIKNEEIISDRDYKILYELTVNQKSTAQLFIIPQDYKTSKQNYE